MKTRTKFASLALLITLIFILTSCPASPPLAPSDGFKPYLAPEEPSNVEATNGYADSIGLKWDKVEDATSYQVWATPVDQYGMVTKATSETETYSKLIARGFELIDVVTESSCKLRDLEANTAYVFSVVAMKAMKNTQGTTVLYSEPSAFVQGATFGEITLSAVSNSKTITLLWNISNLYSILTNSREKEALYNYNISIYRKLSSSSDWQDAKDLTEEEAKKQSFSFPASSLEIDCSYDFRLRLQVLDADENVVNTVESDVFTIITDSSPAPDSVEDIVATNGLTRHEVTLTWTAPALADREDIKSLFMVQRSEAISSSSSSGSATSTSSATVWTEITSPITQNSDGSYSITDSTLEDNTIYTYRIINGYQIGEKTPVYQNEEDAATIQDVYALWMPEDVEFNFTANADNKSGELTVSYTYNPPVVNPSDVIKCYIGGATWTERDLSTHTELEKQEVSDTSPTYQVSIEDTKPLTYYSFYFIFTLNDEELANVTSPEDFTLGETGAANLIENLNATTTWVKAICLTWNETDEITSSSQTFLYEIYQDNVKLDSVEISGTGNTKSAYIASEDGVSHNYRIKVASEGSSVFEIVEAKGTTLAIPTGLNASDGTSITDISITWPQLDISTVLYTLKYSYDGTTWTDLPTSTTTPEGSSTPMGIATLPAKTDGTDGSLVNFKLVVSNSEQIASGLARESDILTLESDIETGCVLGPALLNVRTENNGLDPDKITIKWDKVAGADHYRVMRDGTLLPWSKNADTYEDNVSAIKALSGESPLNATYTYTVIPCLEDGQQATITSLSTTAITTGKLFAPPMNVSATKGQEGITLTWNAVENASSYQIIKYIVELKNGKVQKQVQSGAAITVDSTGSEIETYVEKDKTLLSGNVLYKMCAIMADGTSSQWQESYSNVKNSLGFEEAANIGYKLQDVSDLNVSSVIDEAGYYADYASVSWYMVQGATSYTLNSYTGTETKTLVGSSTVSIDGLTYSETETVDNGVSGKGFLSFNPVDELYTYYDGNDLFKDSYEITYYEIIANNGPVKSGTTNRNTSIYKQPNAKDWTNIILNILRPAFKATNQSFSGDWWIDNSIAWKNSTESYTHPNTGMVFNLETSGISASYPSAKNYLSITSYKDTSTKLTLSTAANIQFGITNGGGAGNLGTDPLNIIGFGGNGTITASPEDGKLKSFTITFNDVSVTSTPGGSFTVTITDSSGSNTYTVDDSSDLTRVLGD